MATEEIRVSALIQASPNRIYAAWLDERQHSAFTGGRATVEPWVGGRHTAWEGYAEGMLVELDTGRRIVMTWRTTEFPKDAEDSRVEVRLDPVAGGTKINIIHTEVPEGQAEKYKAGWKEFYLEPMKKFFGKPGAMREAIRAASRARRLPIPGVTSARPGTVRPKLRRPPKEVEPPPVVEEEAPPPPAKKPAAASRPDKATKKTATKKAAAKTVATKPAAPKKEQKAPVKAPGKNKAPVKAPGKKKAPAKPPPKKKAPAKAPGKKKAPVKAPGKKKAPVKAPGKKKAPAKKRAPAKAAPKKKAPARKK